MYKYTVCGLKNVFLANGYETHQTEYGEGVSIHNIEGLHRVIGLGIIKHCPSLSADEVRFLRKELDMTQRQLASMLGVGESTVRGWENNRTTITPSSDRLLRAIYLDYADGDTGLMALIDLINETGPDQHSPACSLELEETEEGWRQAAA